ncbi:MAG: SUMF1/EgtB/PvdO family nonheme iron enzyme [Planctomycetota bacterium]
MGGVLRGGSWNNNDINLRCANRDNDNPDNRNNNNGFRLALHFQLPVSFRPGAARFTDRAGVAMKVLVPFPSRRAERIGLPAELAR